MKKGFTLVEVVGVVIILGIVALLAFPQLLNLIKNTNNNLSEANKTLIFTAASEYINKYNDDFKKINGHSYCITLKSLIAEDYLSNSITGDSLTLDSIVKVKVTEDKYQYEIDSSCNLNLEYDFDTATNTITKYNGTEKNLNIPSTFFKNGKNYEVYNLASSSFKNKGLESVILPDTLKSIGDTAFSLNNLKEIIIPDNVTTIGQWAFSSNPNLNYVYLGKSVLKIKGIRDTSTEPIISAIVCNYSTSCGGSNGYGLDSFLSQNIDYTFVVSDENITYKSINGAIYSKDGKWLKKAVPKMINNIDAGATGIDVFAFKDMKISTIVIPSTIKNIMFRAFFGSVVTNKQNLIIPNSVEYIGDEAFNGLKFDNIQVGSGIKFIGFASFGSSDTSTVINVNKKASLIIYYTSPCMCTGFRSFGSGIPTFLPE